MTLLKFLLFLFHFIAVGAVVLDYDFKLTSEIRPGKHLDDFARSTSVSDHLFVVGAPWDNYCDGAVTIYDINATSFQGYGTTITPVIPFGFFGSAVAANNEYIVVANSILYLSVFAAVNPYNFVTLLPVPILGDILDLTINSDNTIVVAGLSNIKTGVVHVFDQTGSTNWSLAHTLESEQWSGMALGVSLSISNKFMALGVGCLVGGSDDGKGVVHIYRKEKNQWLVNQTLDPVGTRKSHFGGALMLEGKRLVVAAAGENSVFVYAYDESIGSWTVEDVIRNHQFAESYCLRVAIQEETMAITTEGIGLSFVYTRKEDGKWEEGALLKAVGESRSFNMGMNVHIKGKYVFTGRYTFRGAVYVHDVSQMLHPNVESSRQPV